MTVHVTYRFSGSRNIADFGKTNRASTDGPGLLATWKGGDADRTYEVLHDDDGQERQDDSLIARLTTTQADLDANAGTLDDLCQGFGLVGHVVAKQ